jgi:hypothetical protein
MRVSRSNDPRDGICAQVGIRERGVFAFKARIKIAAVITIVNPHLIPRHASVRAGVIINNLVEAMNDPRVAETSLKRSMKSINNGNVKSHA